MSEQQSSPFKNEIRFEGGTPVFTLDSAMGQVVEEAMLVSGFRGVQVIEDSAGPWADSIISVRAVQGSLRTGESAKLIFVTEGTASERLVMQAIKNSHPDAALTPTVISRPLRG